jgi:hypothetical protein
MRKANTELKNYLEGFAKMMDRSSALSKNNGYHYRSLYHFAVEEFKYYAPKHLNIEEKSHVMRVIKTMGFEPQLKQCFYNSEMLAINDHKGLIKYVEGYAVNIIPTLHGWCEINGKVIDVTWKNERKEIVLGHFPQNRSYAGVTFPTDYIAATILKTGFAGTLIEDYQQDFPVMKNKWDGGNGVMSLIKKS